MPTQNTHGVSCRYFFSHAGLVWVLLCSEEVLNIAGEIRPRSVPPTFEEGLANEPRWFRMDHR